MRIGAIGDTHGNLEYVRIVADLLVKNEKVEEIIHLGDDYHDVDLIEEYDIKLTRIPGVFEDLYKNPATPNRLIKVYNGWKILLTHSQTSHEYDLPDDPKPEEVVANREVQVVLYAHTHIPKIEEKDKILWINPGHLKKEDKKGHPASYGLLDFEREKINARIVDLLNHNVLFAHEFRKYLKNK
ncbi:MAG: YfcE family phosphodiesterase [Candidatus Aenigmarchaeota archaeon]|nr:YfcE family phosphodiesterase [Candidatus Aenigmarchaeota archaeon]